MIPEAIIHVGAGKCGSSSIQKALSRCTDKMKNQGILYHPIGSNHFNYSTLLGGKTRGNNEKAFSSAKQNVSEVHQAIMSDEPNFVIFSGESLFNIDPDKIIELIDFIFPGTPKIHIIAYIRQPAEGYLSHVQQRLKGSGKIIPPQSYKPPIRGKLPAWNENDRLDSINIRHFNRSHLVNQSAVADFSDILSNITQRRIILPEDENNTSLSSEQMIVLQRFRRVALSEHEGKLHPLSNSLINFFHELNKTRGIVKSRPRTKPCIKNYIRRRFSDQIQEMEKIFPGLYFNSQNELENDESYIEIEHQASVDKLLDEWDSDTVRILNSLLPQFSEEPGRAWFYEAITNFNSLAPSKSAKAAYKKFLVISGYPQLDPYAEEEDTNL
mgnify:CR=1 FL=1